MGLPKEVLDSIDSEFNSEKGFFKVFKNSFKYDKVSYKIILCFLTFFIIIFIAAYPIALSDKSKDIFSSILDGGLTLGVGILGFLITGFSIYSTMADKELTFLLIIYKEDNKNISKFHHNHLIFFKPFVCFLVLVFFSIIFKFLLFVWSCIDFFTKLKFFGYMIQYYNIFVVTVISFYIILMLICIYSLKTFIYNIYESTKAIGRLELYRRNCDINSFVDFLASSYTKSDEDKSNENK